MRYRRRRDQAADCIPVHRLACANSRPRARLCNFEMKRLGPRWWLWISDSSSAVLSAEGTHHGSGTRPCADWCGSPLNRAYPDVRGQRESQLARALLPWHIELPLGPELHPRPNVSRHDAAMAAKAVCCAVEIKDITKLLTRNLTAPANIESTGRCCGKSDRTMAAGHAGIGVAERRLCFASFCEGKTGAVGRFTSRRKRLPVRKQRDR
jgi:hypothetical protein